MATSNQPSGPEITPGLEQARELDRVVNDNVRLMILGIMYGAEEVGFKFLESSLKLSPGNLGFQMSKLEDAGYVTVHKSFKGRTPTTSYRITQAGEEAIMMNIQRMDAYKQDILSKQEKRHRLNQANAPT